MSDILEKLYFGRIRPYEKGTYPNTEQDKYHKMDQMAEQIANTLDEQTRLVFVHYIELHDEIYTEALVEAYQDGFKTAVKLILAGIAE